ncbi:MAG TPA: GNAT family N-acetyltransferase [Acidobacteriaceae bacterium]|nr:GNAT family N-acetyltransferase [Acidobacteriaceae bacterium]
MISIPDMEACVVLQQSVWQFADLDVIPRRMFVVAGAIGGQVFGAWDGTKLVGYVVAVPGVRDGFSYLHSHMLAVSPEYRNRGIGKMLKIAQREDALTRGINLIEWTFDPMETKNAYFNIERLGAVVRRYTPDFYGLSTSPLHGALPTDRLHAEWWLKSERVLALMAEQDMPDCSIEETITVTYETEQTGDTLQPLPALALELLLEVRRQFLAAFSSGFTVLRFQKMSGGSACYGLGRWDESDAIICG